MADAKTINTRIVLRNDELSAWEKSEKQLLKGEVAFARLSGTNDFEMRIGTGDKTWSELSDSNVVVPDSTKFYEKATFAELEAVVGKNGDIGVVKEEIAAGKYSYTAYRFDKATNGWVALDGNYNASNVIFDEDLTYTTGLGVIAAPTGGSGTLTTAGRSVEDLFKQILAKESTSITIDTNWAASFTANTTSITGEIGNTFTTEPVLTLKATDAPNWASYGGIDSNGNKVGQNSTGSKLSGEILNGSTQLTSGTDITSGTGTVATYTVPLTAWSTTTLLSGGTSVTYKANAKASASTSKPVTNLGNLILGASVTNITTTGGYTADNYANAKGGFGDTAVLTNSEVKITATGYYPAYYAFTTSPKSNPTALTANNGNVTVDGVTYTRELNSYGKTTFTTNSKWYELFYLVPVAKRNSTGWTGKDGNNVDLAVEAKTQATITFKDGSTALYNVYVVRNAAQYAATTCTMKFA